MKTNTKPRARITTHEGGLGQVISPEFELRRRVLTCLLFEPTFYESGEAIAEEIAQLIPRCSTEFLCDLAVEARDKFHLRHVPLFVLRELCRRKGVKTQVANALAHVIQRPDELGEFLALYWRGGKEPLAKCVRKALAAALTKFDAYQLAKWDRSSAAVKLRDVLRVIRPKPSSKEQSALWKSVLDNTLPTPDTWEVGLSAAKSPAEKKAVWERLITERKLPGMATLFNLRNMLEVGVSRDLIRQRLLAGCRGALPYRFVTAAKHALQIEPEIELSMFKSLEGTEKLPGRTILLVDVSGSMFYVTSGQSATQLIDIACGLAILLRELCDSVEIFVFSSDTSIIPPRRGFALRDAIVTNPVANGGTYLGGALDFICKTPSCADSDRLIVITDEQSHDTPQYSRPKFWKRSYVINVAPYKTGMSYGNTCVHIDGWSDAVVTFIREWEALSND